MEKAALKDLIYGGLNELVQNNQYYYHSNVGPNYSHWTEEGSRALSTYLHTIAELMFDTEHESLDKRAKELVLKGLKGEKV
jgi:hypothetical protein